MNYKEQDLTIKNHPQQKFEFIESEWKSPEDMGNSCANPPNELGIYLIVFTTYNRDVTIVYRLILYVGSSKNLYKRYNTHNLLGLIKSEYRRNMAQGKIGFWFKPEPNYLQVEKEMIKDIQPFRNFQHK